MKKKPISIICGILAILITVILYFVILGNIFTEIICFITLLGVVFAEIIVTALAYFSKGDPRKVAAAALSAIMVPVSITLSIVYIINFPFGYGTYAGWYFAILLAVMAVVAVLWRFSNNANKDNTGLQSAKENMLNLRKIVKIISLDPYAEKYIAGLNAIEEKLHFSNDTVITEQDETIKDMLTVLQNSINTQGFDPENYIERILIEIEKRNIMANRTV